MYLHMYPFSSPHRSPGIEVLRVSTYALQYTTLVHIVNERISRKFYPVQSGTLPHHPQSRDSSTNVFRSTSNTVVLDTPKDVATRYESDNF